MSDMKFVATKPSNPLRFIEWFDFISKKIQPKRYIIDELIPAKSFVIISGMQKETYKSTFATLLSMVAATGQSYDNLKTRRQHKVRYVALEGAEEDIIRAWRRLGKIPALSGSERLQQARRSLAINNFEDIYSLSLDLDSELDRDRLLWMVQEDKPDMVVLDNWTYLKAANENDATALSPAVKCLTQIRTLGTTVVLICHTNKSSDVKSRSIGGVYLDIDNELRGSNLLANAYDVHLAFRKRGKEESGKLSLYLRSRTKGRELYDVVWDVVGNEEDPDNGTPDSIKYNFSISTPRPWEEA